MGNLSVLQNRIGYIFNKEELLLQALTHSSYANERKIPKLSCNERLEFLGDAVLELITSEILFVENPLRPEGELTKLRASLVCETALTECAKTLGLGAFLLLGKGEAATGGRERSSLLSDAVEALIGGIYLDGGFTEAKEFIKNHILLDLEEKKLFLDSKTILQEYVQGEYKKKLSYHVISEEGPDTTNNLLWR